MATLSRFHVVPMEGRMFSICRLVDDDTGTTYIGKRYNLDEKGQNEKADMEIRVLKALHGHPNIVRLHQVIEPTSGNTRRRLVVLERMDGDLVELLQARMASASLLPERTVRDMMRQLLNGLAALHEAGFMHRDVKPENILYRRKGGADSSSFEIQLCDFGWVRPLARAAPYSDYVSTRWYRAPEILLCAPAHDAAIDIFACGCFMAELYTLLPLCPGMNELDQLDHYYRVLGAPTNESWPDGMKLYAAKGMYVPNDANLECHLSSKVPQASPAAISLMQSMLHWDPRRRPSAAAALRHPYFSSLDSDEKLDDAPPEAGIGAVAGSAAAPAAGPGTGLATGRGTGLATGPSAAPASNLASPSTVVKLPPIYGHLGSSPPL